MPVPSIVLDIVLGFAIGLTLGLLGGGGSILTVPALVYLVGQPPAAAVTASLVIVGANSAVGVFLHRAQGTLNWRVALLFGGAGMVTAYAAAGWSRGLSPQLVMSLFALLMLVIGGLMLASRPAPAGTGVGRGLLLTLVSGAVVGVVTGFLGVGGGFLIVPALVLLVGLPMREAVGTSLVVIAMNSAAGFLGHLGGVTPDFTVIALFIISGLAGTTVGTRFSGRISPEHLRRAFAVFVILLAIVLLIDNVGRLAAG
jgi:uncharacterized membrane protein YfcA